jgi:hypothetical protein
MKRTYSSLKKLRNYKVLKVSKRKSISILCYAYVELDLELKLQLEGGGLSSSLVNPRLHTKNLLCIMPGSAF